MTAAQVSRGLKPCPMCGGAASAKEIEGAPGYFHMTVEHAGCFFRPEKEVLLLSADDLERWNRRAPAAPAVPVPGYDSGVQAGSRVTLAFDTQSNAAAWFEKFSDDYDAAASTKSIKLPVPAASAKKAVQAAPRATEWRDCQRPECMSLGCFGHCLKRIPQENQG